MPSIRPIILVLLFACGGTASGELADASDSGSGAAVGEFGACSTAPIVCSIDNGMACVEYVGSAVADAICSQDSTEPEVCSVEGLIGCCVSNGGTSSETVTYMYDSYYDEASAKYFCDQMNGDYTAG